MLGRIGFVNRDVQLGAAADKAFATLQAGGVHRGGEQTFCGKEFERTILALQVERAHVGHHDAGNLAHDFVEARLAVARFGHDVPQPAHNDAQRRFRRYHAGLFASLGDHDRAHSPPGPRGGLFPAAPGARRLIRV